jgi:hypothetical protein
MEFWASTECHDPAYQAVSAVRRAVEPYLNAAFAESSLADVQAKFRYVPIVMPEEMHARYPARSKLRKKERVYDCAPILNYDTFVNGNFQDQLREYLRGIALCSPHLDGIGLSAEQIREFEAILNEACERIMAERSDQTRH